MSLRKVLEPLTHVSLRIKLVLIFISVFGVSMLVFALAIFNFLTNTLQREFDGALYNYAVDVLDSISLSPWGGLEFEGSELDQEKIYPFSLGTALIQITNRRGQVVAKVGELGNFILPFDPAAFDVSNRQDASYMTILDVSGLESREAETYRMISFPVDDSPRPMLILQVAAPMTLLENQIANRKLAFQFGIPLVLLVATLGGMLLSYRALKPIRRMIDQAGKISGDQLAQRLPVPRAGDEIEDLALTLNSMLDRLQKSFESQDRFVADASHQLLTPLSIMKGQLEEAIRREPGQSALWKEQLTEVDRLIRLVKDMLVLARVDSGMDALHLSDVEMNEVIIQALQQLEKARPIHGRKVQLRLSENSSAVPKFKGDPELIKQLVFNLIENAVKYSPEEGSVRVMVEEAPDWISLVVENEAPPLTPTQLRHLFDRFYRVHPSSPQHPGFGLGLAIAHRIAEVHGGNLSAENAQNSAQKSTIRFRLQLPLRNFNL